MSNEVSACNGNASYSDTDLALPGKGMPLLFARSYNAQDSRQGPFGPGWTHSFDMALTFNPFSTVVMVRQGDGRRDKYVVNADGTYTGQAGVYETLVKNGDNTYTLTQKDQTKFNFNASGRLTNVVDRNNNAITPTYDANGRITTITDTAGRVVTLAYNASAKVSSLTDNIARRLDLRLQRRRASLQRHQPAGRCHGLHLRLGRPPADRRRPARQRPAQQRLRRRHAHPAEGRPQQPDQLQLRPLAPQLQGH